MNHLLKDVPQRTRCLEIAYLASPLFGPKGTGLGSRRRRGQAGVHSLSDESMPVDRSTCVLNEAAILPN